MIIDCRQGKTLFVKSLELPKYKIWDKIKIKPFKQMREENECSNEWFCDIYTHWTFRAEYMRKYCWRLAVITNIQDDRRFSISICDDKWLFFSDDMFIKR